MNERDELAERYFGVIQRMVKNECEFCGKCMTEEEYNFCDICPNCRDKNYDNE